MAPTEVEKALPADTCIESAGSDKSATLEEDYDARINVFTPEEQRAIIWRIDVRLVLTLGFMYCVSLIDRTNLGIAAVAGMSYDLKLSVGSRYSLITLVFFVSLCFYRNINKR